jgi:hypothetical protein
MFIQSIARLITMVSSFFLFCYKMYVFHTSHELRAAFRGCRLPALVDFLRGFHS